MSTNTVSKDGYVAITSAFAAVGAAGIAALTSVCCIGPAVIALLGTSGAVAAAGLGPYRLYFLIGSFALLGLGFWRAYRPARSGGACAIRTGRVVRVVLWSSLAATAVAAILPYVIGNF